MQQVQAEDKSVSAIVSFNSTTKLLVELTHELMPDGVVISNVSIRAEDINGKWLGTVLGSLYARQGEPRMVVEFNEKERMYVPESEK